MLDSIARVTKEGEVVHNSEPILVGLDKGFVPPSLMKFNLGVAGPRAWIGDQILLDSKRPRLFTLVAHTRVVVYQIELKDFFLRMPADFVKKQTYVNT